MTPLSVVQACAIIGITSGLGVLLLLPREEGRGFRETCICTVGLTLLCVGGVLGLCALVLE